MKKKHRPQGRGRWISSERPPQKMIPFEMKEYFSKFVFTFLHRITKDNQVEFYGSFGWISANSILDFDYLYRYVPQYKNKE